MISGGTPNFCSMRASNDPCRSSICRPMLMRPGPTRVETYCSNDLLKVPRWRRSKASTAGSCVTPPKRLADHRLRNPGGRRLLRHRRHEGVEIAAAAGGVSGGGADDGAEENGPTKHAHANPLLRLAPIMPWDDAARNLVVPANALFPYLSLFHAVLSPWLIFFHIFYLYHTSKVNVDARDKPSWLDGGRKPLFRCSRRRSSLSLSLYSPFVRECLVSWS